MLLDSRHRNRVHDTIPGSCHLHGRSDGRYRIHRRNGCRRRPVLIDVYRLRAAPNEFLCQRGNAGNRFCLDPPEYSRRASVLPVRTDSGFCGRSVRDYFRFHHHGCIGGVGRRRAGKGIAFLAVLQPLDWRNGRAGVLPGHHSFGSQRRGIFPSPSAGGIAGTFREQNGPENAGYGHGPVSNLRGSHRNQHRAASSFGNEAIRFLLYRIRNCRNRRFCGAELRMCGIHTDGPVDYYGVHAAVRHQLQRVLHDGPQAVQRGN